MNVILDRLTALHDALRALPEHPSRQDAWFTAAALMRGSSDASTAPAATLVTRNALKAALPAFAGPSGSLRWVYAAILTVNETPVANFLQAREALRAAARSARAGSLHAGGARAALVLSTSAAPNPELVADFFAFKRALRPAWWRRDPSVTDTFAAAHAATGATPATILRLRQDAEALFARHRTMKAYQIEGARLCALLNVKPKDVVSRFAAVDEARRANSWLKHRIDRHCIMEWAVQGLNLKDLAEIEAIMRALPRSVPCMASSRARLAHLALTADRPGQPAGSVAALGALIAAQAALVAAMVATTAATTSAS